MDAKEMKIEKLGEKERMILLRAIDIDWTDLKCQYCKEKVYYTNCGIMPSINTKQLATIICDSPLCICEYLESLESEELKPCCVKAIQEAKKEEAKDIEKIIDDTEINNVYEKLLLDELKIKLKQRHTPTEEEE